MNERIKILWETANIRFTNDYQLSGKPREECRSVPDIFAELIVKECFKAAMIESKGHMNPIHLMKRMKEHVGVEE